MAYLVNQVNFLTLEVTDKKIQRVGPTIDKTIDN